MRSFEGISFWWALFGLAALALIFGLRSWLGRRQVVADANADYDYRMAQTMVPNGLSREHFVDIYRRVHGPRVETHIFAGVMGILIATPIIMFILEQGLNVIYNLSGQSRVIEPGFLVWQFFIFFGVLATWVMIAYFVSRHYHRHSPASLQAEIDTHLYGGTDHGEAF